MINETGKSKSHINMTTKSSSHKKIIVSMSGENINKFIVFSSEHVVIRRECRQTWTRVRVKNYNY